jgi:hypothetical protein
VQHELAKLRQIDSREPEARAAVHRRRRWKRFPGRPVDAERPEEVGLRKARGLAALVVERHREQEKARRAVGEERPGRIDDRPLQHVLKRLPMVMAALAGSEGASAPSVCPSVSSSRRHPCALAMPTSIEVTLFVTERTSWGVVESPLQYCSRTRAPCCSTRKLAICERARRRQKRCPAACRR